MVKFVPSLLNQKKLTFTETLLLGKKTCLFFQLLHFLSQADEIITRVLAVAKIWAIFKTLIVQNTNFVKLPSANLFSFRLKVVLLWLLCQFDNP